MAVPSRVARPSWGINHILAYGQSLSSGWEGFPALSAVPRHDNLMLGDCVRPRWESAPKWQTVGATAFRPLRATVQDPANGALLTPERVARASADATLLGETILEGAINFLRARMIEEAGGRDMRSRLLLGSSCGVGGRSLEQLSRGAEPELFARLRGCVRVARDVAALCGRDYGLLAILLLQGENNNWGLDGATSDRAAYAALLRKFHADAITDLASAIVGQADPPALFLYQTGGAYASVSNAIPQAQLDVALTSENCFLAAPAYPVTDKGGHLDANGYRWLGAQFGKVMHGVICHGEPWRPLHPLVARRDGAAVEVSFHVPHPPLTWGMPYRGHEPYPVPHQGFSVDDARGPADITHVTLAGPDRVRLSTARALTGDVMVRYADAAHSGVGALRDSDPCVSDDAYSFTPGIGHWPSAAIADLVGKPYPLHNWCVVFSIPVA